MRNYGAYWGILILLQGHISWTLCSTTTAATFEGLGIPSWAISTVAEAISDDGSVVVGQAGEAHGFMWTRDTGMIELGQLEGTRGEYAWGVSGDGRTVVGSTVADPSPEPGFRWTQAGGFESLGWFPGNWGHQTASLGPSSASYDGSVVVGEGFYPGVGSRAFRWTEAGGLVSLGILNVYEGSSAKDVSGDGSVIVGDSSGTPFRWTQNEGMVALPWTGYASAVSQDGTTVVGTADVPFAFGQAVRWTEAEGMQTLDFLPSSTYSFATGVSADGSVVVGVGVTKESPIGEVFIWDSGNGMRSLDSLLQSEGVDLNGWQLTRAAGVSANGNTIAGWGINPKGQYESWIAVIPEPNSLSIFVFGALLLWFRSRNKERTTDCEREATLF